MMLFTDLNLGYADAAQYLASATDYDYAYAKRNGITDIQIIDYLRQSRDVSKPMAFLEGAAREGTRIGTAITLASLGGKAGSYLGKRGTVAGGVAGFGVGLLTGPELERAIFPEEPLPAHTRRASNSGRKFSG